MSSITVRMKQLYDTAENWSTSSKILLAGEIAVESDTNKFKFGDGEKTFSQLPYAGADVAQIQSLIDASEDNYTVIDATAEQTDEEAIQAAITSPAKGDLATVCRVIKDDKKTYSLYVYDGEKWEAADGAYDASNVYFKNDFTLAGDYTSIGNVKLSDGTLSASGQSVEALLTSILTKELNTGLKTGDPTAAISSFTQYYEIGSNGSKSVTMSLNADGSYKYGYSTNPAEPTEGQVATSVKNDGSTGVVVDTSVDNPYSVTFNGTTTESATATFTLEAPIKLAKTEMKAKGTVKHTQGGVPVSNLNKAYPAQRIPAGTKTSGESAVFRWYVPYYSGFIYGAENKMPKDAPDVSKLTKATDSTAYTASKPKTATAAGSWSQYWLVFPKTYGWTMTDAKDSNNLTVAPEKKENVLSLTFGSGEGTSTTVAYDAIVIDMADPYDTKTISWS